VRSEKSKTLNTGSTAGAYEDGLRLAQTCENAVRSLSSVDGLTIDIYTPMQYVGMSEDDMHFWTMNLRIRECVSSFDVYYGRSATIDNSIFDSGESVNVFSFYRAYTTDDESGSPYVAIDLTDLGDDTFSVVLQKDDGSEDASPTIETIDGFRVYHFSHEESGYKIVIK